VSIAHAEMGYCQGLNFIAAVNEKDKKKFLKIKLTKIIRRIFLIEIERLSQQKRKKC